MGKVIRVGRERGVCRTMFVLVRIYLMTIVIEGGQVD